METITLDTDIKVLYTTAASFPDGIVEAHEKLHLLIPFSEERKYFGISRPEGDGIVYRAAAEELYPGEAARFKLATLILKKGRYICITVKDYISNLPDINHAFTNLIEQSEIDPMGYCVEWYYNNRDVRCMVRLDDEV
jgi:hypothetical protein